MSQQSTTSTPTAAPGPRDGLFFLTILMNMRNKPEVDWDLVAQEAGFKNAKVASTRFGQMKKKFSGEAGSAPTTPSTSFASTATIANTPTPSPSKKVKKQVGSGTNVSSGRIKKTPVKGNGLSRGPNVKVGAKLEAENEDEDVIGVFIDDGIKCEDSDGDYMGAI